MPGAGSGWTPASERFGSFAELNAWLATQFDKRGRRRIRTAPDG